MEHIVANVDNITFATEVALEQELGVQLLPFYGMDKSKAAVCESYLKGTCSRGQLCPFRHLKGNQTVVCKHWLRSLCKKGDECEFLHQFDMSKMPECQFYSSFKECRNKDCLFLHIDPESKIKDCQWYDRGHCRHGPNCTKRHTRRIMCVNYMVGFCIDGPDCKHKHPKFDIPVVNRKETSRDANMLCFSCKKPGHKAFMCPNRKPRVPEPPKIEAMDTLDTNHTQAVTTTGTRNAEHRSSGEVILDEYGEREDYGQMCFQARPAVSITEMKSKEHSLIVLPETKSNVCPRYDKGFCPNGPNCQYRHTRSVMCRDYFQGFCINGLKCKRKHIQATDPEADSHMKYKRRRTNF